MGLAYNLGNLFTFAEIMLKTLYKQIGEYKTASVLTPLFTSLEVVMDVLIPYVTARLIDDGLNAGNMGDVYFYGAVMVGMACVSLLFGILAGRYSAYASSGFAANLRRAMYRNVQTFSFSDIDKFSTSGLVTRMTTDVTNLQNAYQQILRVTVRAPYRLVLSIVMCVVINPQLSFIFIIATVILSVFLYLVISRVAKLFTQVFQQYDVLNQCVQENISGIRVVKAFVREDYETLKFSRAAQGLYRLYVRSERLMALNHPVMNMVVYGCIIAISWFGAHLVVGGSLTTGELTSLFTYVMSILMSLMMLSMIFVMLTMSAASGKRVAEVIDEKADIVDPEKPVYELQSGAIDFENVCFAYHGMSLKQLERFGKLFDSLRKLLGQKALEGDYALRKITLSVKSGESIGIIGGTGSGKSSLVNLVSRLYDATEGTVKVGGRDVRSYALAALRNSVSVVLQKNVLFSGTILDNLRWGNAEATLEQCREACRCACADEFIDQLPDGYETRVEQGGANFSGGQRQRLCIARALLKRPKVLILDDSTSACDTATDAKIRKALREELPAMTKLIIAQRIASVQDCDRILVMENGQVSGFDTHERLLQTNELYREIYQIQTENGGDFDEPGSQAKGGDE
jgi:ATP-binding cassette subfamily B protein